MSDALYLARTVALAATADDGSVQMFPPGTMKVAPLNSATGKAEEIELTIDAQAAEVLEEARATMQAAADVNQGDAPFIDFNHDDREAAAWVKEIYWAGDDPQTGGVRARVEWTAAGDEAVKGKTFRRFSPTFHADGGRVTGAPVNMGGLVNRAAFHRIQPLFAKDGDPPNRPNPPTMTEDEIKALQEENAKLKDQLATMQAKMDELAKKDAQATVDLAAKEGRIGPAPELKAKWVDSILKDPSAADLLMAMAPNPALTSGAATTQKKDDAETPAALLAKYHELPREERPAFYAKHKAELKRALG